MKSFVATYITLFFVTGILVLAQHSQATTLGYNGPTFDYSLEDTCGPGLCAGSGHISATVTFSSDLPNGYYEATVRGNMSAPPINANNISWTMSSPFVGIIGFSYPDTYGSASFTLSAGLITSWDFYLTKKGKSITTSYSDSNNSGGDSFYLYGASHGISTSDISWPNPASLWTVIDPAPAPAPVPVPGTALLLGSGLVGLAAVGRRKK